MATTRLSLLSLSVGAERTRGTIGRDHVRAAAVRRRRAERAATEPTEVYASTVRRVAFNFAVKRFGWDFAEDIAQATVMKFCTAPEHYMTTYPSAEIFAISAARTAGIDLGRRQRAQRGEGANLRTDSEGQVEVARRVVSIDHEPCGEFFAGTIDIADVVIGELAFEEVLSLLSPLDRTILELHVRDQFRVVEIADHLGMVSSTVSRRLARAISCARAALIESPDRDAIHAPTMRSGSDRNASTVGDLVEYTKQSAPIQKDLPIEEVVFQSSPFVLAV